MKKGIWYAVGAYVVWGVFPIYWKLLHDVPALELICHRIIWSSLMLGSVILLSRQWRSFWSAVRKPQVFAAYSIAAMLIGINWLTYIWAVNSGFIVESSLGYFINPIISVILGVIFLRERLRRWQWFPVGLAVTGVLFLTWAYGSLPWIALTLASTFAGYGLIKKISPLGSLYGLTLETAVLSMPALMYLVHIGSTSGGAFPNAGLRSGLLLTSTGLVTTVPLLLFASATRRIPLSLLGILQYISPTLQFLCGVVIYAEPFTHVQLVGFAIVWTGLIIFAVEGFVVRRAESAPAVVNII